MSGTTSHYALRYPDLTDTPDGATQIADLAGDVDTALYDAVHPALTAYTPACYTAMSGTPASLAATVNYANYIQLPGGLIWASFEVTPSATSSGGFGIDLPAAAAFRHLACGVIGVYGATPPSGQTGIARMFTDSARLIIASYTAAYLDVTSGYQVCGNVVYKMA